jgi:phenylacetate-CoA ligase
MPEALRSSSLYTRFASGLLFPLQERLKHHHSVELRRSLERTQWLSPEVLEAQQIVRLRQFLGDVARQVPYYERLFAEHSFDPASIATLADLARLPLLDKALIRANLDALKSRSAGTLVKYNTGGSSGEPLVFYMGMGRVSHDVAAKWRATRWWGVDIGDPEIVLWGSPVELGKQDKFKALRDRLLRSHLLPAFDMGDSQMDEYLSRIRLIRPRMMFGYASALAILARHADRRAIRMNDVDIRVVFATGETLYPDQRADIERVFGAPVANGYGSRDAGFIAHQCPKGALHLSTEHVIVEIVDTDGQAVPRGETGEVVVTHLATHDFPFIRYRTGDMASLSREHCSCGRGLPLLGTVHGRSTDFIVTAAGGRMHALALIYEVRDKPGVHAFKFIQSEDLSLELQIQAGDDFSAEVESDIRQGVLRRMGQSTALTLRRVDSIPPEPSGKYRYVVSRIAPTRSAADIHAEVR